MLRQADVGRDACPQLDADVVGAGVEVLARTLGDGGSVAPGDDRVDGPVTPSPPGVVAARRRRLSA
jgi:hypothetical protein